MKKNFWIKKVIGIIILIPIAVAIVGYINMYLWNAVLVPVLHVSAVTFWQALGILMLSKILFGGFRGRGRNCGGRGREWKLDMKEKWEQMTAEQREQMKNNWRNKCGSWRSRPTSSNENEAEIKGL